MLDTWKSKKSKSTFLNNDVKRGSLKYAISRSEAALIPPELEKKSIQSPNKKLRNKNKPRSLLRGYNSTQAI